MNNNITDPYLQQALDEHEHLHHRVFEIAGILAEHTDEQANEAAAAKLMTRLRELRAELWQHFMQEEEGGYLEEALSHAPQLQPQADALQRQHASLTEEMDAILKQADAAPTVPERWRRLQETFPHFRQRLCGHEAAENALLQRAFNVDLGVD